MVLNIYYYILANSITTKPQLLRTPKIWLFPCWKGISQTRVIGHKISLSYDVIRGHLRSTKEDIIVKFRRHTHNPDYLNIIWYDASDYMISYFDLTNSVSHLRSLEVNFEECTMDFFTTYPHYNFDNYMLYYVDLRGHLRSKEVKSCKSLIKSRKYTRDHFW